MKKDLHANLKFAFIAFMLFSARFAMGQVVFTSSPDSIAVVNLLYSYTPTFVSSPNAPTFSLQTSPAGMTINSSTGLVSWTPANMTLGGPVVIKAHNNTGDYYQSYFIYITNSVVCDTNMISYWPLDGKAGSSVPEKLHSYDGLWEGAPGPEPTVSPDGMIGGAVKFDPTSNEDWGYNVRDANQYEFKNVVQFSVSFWFKNQPSLVTQAHHEQAFIGRWCGNQTNDAGWYIDWNPNNEHVEFYMRDSGPTDTLLVNPVTIAAGDEEWHHVVATFYNGPDLQQKSYMHLFVDGTISELLYDFYSDDFTGTKDLNLGYYYWGLVPYSGYLDEVAVWKKELLQSDVNALLTEGMAHQPTCHDGAVAPIITSTQITQATQDIIYSYHLTYRSASGSSVVMSAPVLPSWLTFNANTGILSGTPTNDNVGDHNVTLRVSSGDINIDQQFIISVANVNDPPVISTTPSTTGNVDELYTYIIAATDPDANTTLTYSAPVLPSWLTFDTSQKLLVGTPAQANKGNNSVSLAVSDGILSTPQTFVIVVSGPSGINDKSASFAKVYPVPASDYINFDFAERLDKADLQIFNTSGSLVKTVDVSKLSTYRLDVTDLRHNSYIYRISTPKGNQTGPIVVK